MELHWEVRKDYFLSGKLQVVKRLIKPKHLIHNCTVRTKVEIFVSSLNFYALIIAHSQIRFRNRDKPIKASVQK